jgi:hypothetical protein
MKGKSFAMMIRNLMLLLMFMISLFFPCRAFCGPEVLARASVVAGVAPLAVVFDASGTTHSDPETDPFRDIDYEWSFGDKDPGDWALFGGSKNHAKGPVAAHIYEQPGVYGASLCVRDGQSAPVKKFFTIQALDPDRVFTGERTVCFSGNGDFEGCPEDAALITLDDLSGLGTYIEPHRRLLFHRGETWTASAPIRVNVPGPGIIGAYGSGTSPDARGIYSNNPEFRMLGCGVPLIVLSDADPRFNNWRIMDLSLTGDCSGNPPNGVQAAGTTGRTLLFRLCIKAFRNGILIPNSILDYWNRNRAAGHSLHSELTIADCVITEAFGGKGGCLLYLNAEDMAVIGNELKDASGAEHVLRIPFADRAVISHNLLAGPGPRKHTVKLHGPVWSDEGLGFQRTTRRVVISGNLFEARDRNDWNAAIAPRSSRYDEHVQDVIVEGNLLRSAGDAENQIGVKVSGRRITVRNNIFDATGGSPYYSAVSISRRGLEPPPMHCTVYNNTLYRGDGENRISLAHVGEEARGTRMVNNLLFAPRVRDVRLLSDEEVDIFETHNRVASSLPFAVETPHEPDDFRLFLGSPAIDSGASVTVFRDIRQQVRPQDGNGDGRAAWDAGAHEFSLTGGGRP